MTLVTSGLAVLICLGVSALVITGVRGREADYRRERVAGDALRVIHLIKRNRLPPALAHEHADVIQVLNARGRVVAATPRLTGLPRIADLVPTEDSVRADTRLCPPRGLDGCMTVVAFRVYQPDGDWLVYSAGRVVPWFVSARLVAFLSGVSVLLIALTAAGTGRTVSRTLAPVDAIRAELAEITVSDLSHRVPVPKDQNEIRLLAETANATLDRLQGAVQQLSRFTSDASHDLRSPITAMRAQVEEALLHPDLTDWPQMAEAVLSSLDRLQAIVADLLTLARLDAGAPQACERLDLARVVAGELARRPRSVRVETVLCVGVEVQGDRLRLTRLLTNLVDNAERHALGKVTVTVRGDASQAVLEVVDDGSGIAHEQRELVFQRFTRLDAARSRDAGGTGLGLPIARQIAEAHGGTLSVEDSPCGARFVLRLPAAPRTVRTAPARV